MSSKLQIAANRRNASKSTGPRSIEGKAVSSRNSFKTGIYSESLIVEGEKGEDLNLLVNEYFTRFRPSTPEDRALVDALAHDEWLLRRFRRIEAQIFERRLERLDLLCHEPGTHNSGDAYLDLTQVFSCLQRRINDTERSFHRALQQLQSRQPERESPPIDRPPARPEPVTPVEPSVTADPEPIGFVPQNPQPGAAGPSVRPAPSPSSGRRPPQIPAHSTKFRP